MRQLEDLEADAVAGACWTDPLLPEPLPLVPPVVVFWFDDLLLA